MGADRTNQYVSSPNVTSTTAAALDFGFVANRVFVVNDLGATVYVNLDSSVGSATTGFPILTTCSLLLDVQTSVMGLATAATSTSATVRVGAWRF